MNTITPRDCDECNSIYQNERDTILKCGHRLPVAYLAANSQGGFTFEKGHVNGNQVSGPE